MIISRSGVAIIGYTTQGLLTYLDTNGNLLEAIHDYSEWHSDEYINELRRRREKK